MCIRDRYNANLGQFEQVEYNVTVAYTDTVANYSALPLSGNTLYDGILTLDTDHLYVWFGINWVDQGKVFSYPIIDQLDDVIAAPSYTASQITTNIPGDSVQDALNYLRNVLEQNQGTIRYVSQIGGSDITGTGSENLPYESVGAALADFADDDQGIIFILPGIYTETLGYVNWKNKISLLGFNGQSTAIRFEIRITGIPTSQTILEFRNFATDGQNGGLITLDLTDSPFSVFNASGGLFHINRLDLNPAAFVLFSGAIAGSFQGSAEFFDGVLVDSFTVLPDSYFRVRDVAFGETIQVQGNSRIDIVGCTKFDPSIIMVNGTIVSSNTPSVYTDAESLLLTSGNINIFYLDENDKETNNSTVTGATTADALNTLQAEKASLNYVDGNASAVTNELKTLSLNIMLTAFRLSVNASLSLRLMIASFIDEYEDQSGINLVDSIDQYYDVNLDAYTSAEPVGSTIVLLHGDDVNGATVIIDEKGHTVSNSGNIAITTGTSKFGGSSIDNAFPFGYLSIADDASMRLGTGDFTIDTWAWLEPGQGTAAFRPFFMIGGDSSNADLNVSRQGGASNYNLVVSGTQLTAPITTGFALPQATWFHLAVTRIGNTVEVYVDGVSKGTTSCTGADFTNGLTYIMGRAVGGGGDQHYGKIDEFRILKGAAVWSMNFTPGVSAYTGNEGTFTVNDITLISNPQTLTVGHSNDEGRLVVFLEDVDAIVENVDIKGYVSRDNGVTFTEFTLIDEGYYSTGQRILSGYGSIAAQPYDTQMVYKITTHNSKNLRIHGTALLWK